MADNMQMIRVVISGRVQGVGYRAWTVKRASELGLKGWVRNRENGTVEAVFSGDEDTIAAMVEACKKGPLLARVDAIESYTYNEPLTEDRFIAKTTV